MASEWCRMLPSIYGTMLMTHPKKRSVVRGEQPRYSSRRAPSCCSAQRQLWNMCQQKDRHTCQKIPLQHIFVMGGKSAADALTTACQQPCCPWAMCCRKLQRGANKGTCCSWGFFRLVLICCCCFGFCFVFLIYWSQEGLRKNVHYTRVNEIATMVHLNIYFFQSTIGA